MDVLAVVKRQRQPSNHVVLRLHRLSFGANHHCEPAVQHPPVIMVSALIIGTFQHNN